MIDEAVSEVEPLLGTAPACRALGASRASLYRRRRPPQARQRRPRPASARALSQLERQALLGVLHSERFADASPAQVWATLLDEGRYLASERTMYRLLAAHGAVRERRDQLVHPVYARPELLAGQPNMLWSWDISKLKGPAKWTYYYLYVILDVYSRYAVGWSVQHRETASLAEQLIAQTITQQQIPPETLTIHADRGSSMTSKPVAFLLADLGVTKTHSRPYTSTDNLLGGALQDAQVQARLPRPLRLDHRGARLLPPVLQLLQPPPPPLRDRPDDPGDRPPRARRTDPRRPPPRPRRRLHGQARAVRPPPAQAASATEQRLDQQARQQGGCSLNSRPSCLTRLDRLRAS